MKIFQLIQKPQLRGAEVFACQLSAHLKALSHESLIVPIFNSSISSLPFDVIIKPLHGNESNRFWDFKAWKNLAKFIEEENPDIIQANAGDTLKYAVMSKVLFGWQQPIVFRNASTISLYIKNPITKLFNGFLLKHVKYVTSVSNNSKTDFLKLYPSFSNRITVLPISIIPVPLPQKKVNDNPVIIHVGGFTYEKNHIGVINIFEKVLSKHPSAKLWLVGDGILKAKIEQLVKNKKLEENVLFLGFRSDAIELINKADVLILPSIIEGLPGVILESFYCRTPVVAFNVGGISEIVTEETGYLYEPYQEVDFASKVCELIANPKMAAEKVEQAYKLVCEDYLDQVIAARFLDTYNKVISEQSQV